MTNPMPVEMSPNSLKKIGIRRVNNVPICLVAGVVIIFIGIMAVEASNRSAPQTAPPKETELKPTSSLSFAAEIAGDNKEGIVEPRDALPHTTDATVPHDKVTAPLGSDLQTPPNTIPPPTDSISEEELQRIKLAKLELLDAAAKAKTSVPVTSFQSQHANRTRTREISSTPNNYRSKIQALQNKDPENSPYLMELAQGNTSDSNTLEQFDKAGEIDRWRLDSKVESPRSAYELRAGFVLPATLISGINSDLPGQITAQVSQHVYDTATGKYILIPQGARLIGAYSNDVGYGQARIFIAWQRIIFPDGKAMDIGAMPGADSAGYAGFNDEVNNHYARIFGSAFLMSGVTAGITLSQRDSDTNFNEAPSASSALSEALGQQLGQVTAQMIAKNLNIAPTLEIRPGYRFNVIAIKDMTFSKPYEAFDYQN